MARQLKRAMVVAIHKAYAKKKSIKAISKDLGIARQTVRRHLRLVTAVNNKNKLPIEYSDSELKTTHDDDLGKAFNNMLNRLLSIAQKDTEHTYNPSEWLVERARGIVCDLGISFPKDLVTVEYVLMEELLYRKASMKARQAMDAAYVGNPNLRHDKSSLTSRRFHEIASRALENSQSFLSDLEIKYRKRSPIMGSGNMFVKTDSLTIENSERIAI